MRLTADLSVKSTALTVTKVEPKEHINLLCDTSGSMATTMDNAKMRIHNMIDAVIALTNASDPAWTAFSLITFETSARVVVNKTNDYLNIQTVRPLPDGATRMDLGISCALQLSPNRVILLSDGEPTCDKGDLFVVVDTAVSLGIKIDTIAIGSADPALMKEIARRTGGTFQQPKDASQLTRSYLKLESREYLKLDHKS